MSIGICVHAGAVEAMLAGDGLPEGSTDLVALLRMLITSSSILSGMGRSTYTLAGLEVNLCAKIWLAMLLCLAGKHAGHACLFQGPVWPLAKGQYVQSRAWCRFWEV